MFARRWCVQVQVCFTGQRRDANALWVILVITGVLKLLFCTRPQEAIRCQVKSDASAAESRCSLAAGRQEVHIVARRIKEWQDESGCKCDSCGSSSCWLPSILHPSSILTNTLFLSQAKHIIFTVRQMCMRQFLVGFLPFFLHLSVISFGFWRCFKPSGWIV